jgi:2,4-dienoyl-CoA reductase-like NADH-dependent reductase (Old Yellow Enzyme family)
MGLNSVCKPLTINNVTIPNRIVFPAFQTNFATSECLVTERLIRMYEKIAKGGSGLIIMGCIAVSDEGAPNTNALKANHDEHVSGLEQLLSAIKENGAVAAAQLIHAGRQTLSVMTGHPIVAPSPIPCPVMKEKPVELDIKGINRIQDDFVSAASRVKKAGAEIIELHGAFVYLIGGFLSPFSNIRIDEYGRNKALFFKEIIEKVKSRIGDTPIICRIREGVHVHLAKAIRDVVDVPVICSNNIRSIEYASRILSDRKADLVAICRPQVADPVFVNRSINKKSVRTCTDCGKCLFFLRGERSVSCPLNPGS